MWRLSVLLLLSGAALSQDGTRPLRVYFIDVEGGQATLIAAPSGETLLIDAGWEGERDANRIAETARRAGIAKIDALLITHFHRDHAGGVPALAKQIPVRQVFDHGENTENYKGSADVIARYRASTQATRHVVVRPGDKIPIRGLNITVIASAGKWITKPLPGAGAANPACPNQQRKPDEHTENEASIGVLLQFGKFRMLDMADLLWNQEIELMCPVNRIGTADLLVVSHHGKDTSNSASLVHAVHPRAAIMNNGETKGGSPETFDILRSSPGLSDLWQLHYSRDAAQRNAPEQFIANERGTCNGNGISVSAGRDGTFRIRNDATEQERVYKPN